MFGRAKIPTYNVWKSQNPEFQFLKKLNLAIPMFSKANLQISNVWKRQNPEFQCKLKPKSRILVFGKVKIENSGVWKSQNLEFQSLKMSKSRFHKNCDYTGKILKLLCERCNFVKFDIHFLGLP